MFEYVIIETYIFIFLLAIIFYILQNLKSNKLIALIIICILIIIIYIYLQKVANDKATNLNYQENTLEDDIKDRENISDKIFYIDKFPKTVKYLKENKDLMKIVTNLRFVIKFNKTRYSDIILNMNKIMKIYIYILSDRYDAVQFIPIFTDIRDNIIEIMYSLFIIIPSTLKHTYGLNPHTEIYRSINEFMILSRNMLTTLEKFGIIHNQYEYIPDNTYRAYNTKTSSFP
jgi:hypothetical protein